VAYLHAYSRARESRSRQRMMHGRAMYFNFFGLI
jgi:hypothetical protein